MAWADDENPNDLDQVFPVPHHPLQWEDEDPDDVDGELPIPDEEIEEDDYLLAPTTPVQQAPQWQSPAPLSPLLKV